MENIHLKTLFSGVALAAFILETEKPNRNNVRDAGGSGAQCFRSTNASQWAKTRVRSGAGRACAGLLTSWWRIGI